MANIYTLGLAKIEIGDIAADGGMSTSLSIWGQTLKGTCNVTQEEGDVIEHYAEEQEEPAVSIKKKGKTTMAFSVMNPDTNTMQKFFGGTVTGTGAAAKWKAPSQTPVIEKSIKITPHQGLIWEFPRVSISARINGQFGRDGIFVIEVAGTALQPEKAGESAYTAYQVVTG
jgi:hypothetical protein